MKKFMFVVMAIFAMFASIAAAPMGASVTLVGVTNGGGGPMFTFHVDGPVSLNGVIHSVVGEYQGDFALHCKQENETTVTCHATKKLSGDSVTIEFGGSRFWVTIPESPNPVQPANCYGYYFPDFSPINPTLAGANGGFQWSEVANICQDTPAANGDIEEYDSDYYEFYDEGWNDGHDYNPGPAYYLAEM